jgi:glycerophosphoryl diester phosphodiesterase
MAFLKLGGHRGFGCTDHDFYQTLRDTLHLPPENTIESIRMAFEHGADYVEIDAMQSADGKIFVLHNVLPEDHFFDPQMRPSAKLNTLSFAEIQKYTTGRSRMGRVSLLDDVLNVIADLDPKTLSWAVNIEIKGVQGSRQAYERTNFLEKLADTVKTSPLDPTRVLFSSFTPQNILRMSHLLPQTSFGMLFCEHNLPYRPIYADHWLDSRYQYLQFNAGTVEEIVDLWQKEAHPEALLGFLHPEAQTVTDEMIDITTGLGMGLNTWARFEQLDDSRRNHYKHLAQYAHARNVPFTVITDYLPEMKKLQF